jgi:hypothetical protein
VLYFGTTLGMDSSLGTHGTFKYSREENVQITEKLHHGPRNVGIRR